MHCMFHVFNKERVCRRQPAPLQLWALPDLGVHAETINTDDGQHARRSMCLSGVRCTVRIRNNIPKSGMCKLHVGFCSSLKKMRLFSGAVTLVQKEEVNYTFLNHQKDPPSCTEHQLA